MAPADGTLLNLFGDKIRFILVGRGKISFNVKLGPFLVVNQLSWDPTSGNLDMPYTSVRIA
jgi:hypothetical protein